MFGNNQVLRQFLIEQWKKVTACAGNRFFCNIDLRKNSNRKFNKNICLILFLSLLRLC